MPRYYFNIEDGHRIADFGGAEGLLVFSPPFASTLSVPKDGVQWR
jgi:hypothetical protein